MTMILLAVAVVSLLLYVALTRWRGHERAELGLGRGPPLVVGSIAGVAPAPARAR